jgi:hypothetical protein
VKQVFSKFFSSEKRMESVEEGKFGSLEVEEILALGTSL